MYQLFRQLAFTLDAEVSHDLTLGALAQLSRLLTGATPAAGRHRRVMGLNFANPVGLAAGLDKNAVAVPAFARLGFGFIEVGTVTPRPQAGNDKPRMFRLAGQQALINRMGFNNAGVDAAVARLGRYRALGGFGQTQIGVNIGKNARTPLSDALGDYSICLAKVLPVADYVTVNLSSPNTPGLRSLQAADTVLELLRVLRKLAANYSEETGRHVPLAVKLAPDLDAEDLVAIADALVRGGADAVIATNTTIARPGLGNERLGREAGGLSGDPLFPQALAVVNCLARELDGAIPIIAAGGISSAERAQRMLDAGASLLQLYTALIYEGPGLVRRLARL